MIYAGAKNVMPVQEDAKATLRARVVKGAGWVSVDKIVWRGLQLIRLVVLARLLSPDDFGVFGIVMLVIAAVETFSRTGFDEALIQREESDKAHLNTAWTVHVIRGIALALILFTLGPAVGWFFEEPRVSPLLQVMCISLVLQGFVNIGIIYFRKELEFHKQFLYDVLSGTVSLTVGVILAYQLRSVWALIWANLAGWATRVSFSYIIHPFRPKFRLDKTEASELFRFGRWVLGTSVVVFLATQGDHAFLGKVLGAGALGLYYLAYLFSNSPPTEITHSINIIMMPAYAKVHRERGRLGRGFLDVFEIVISITLPLAVFIVLAAPEIVLGILGPNWAGAVVPLQILAISGFIRALTATAGPVFLGTGRPHMSFWMNLCRVLAMGITIYPLTMAYGVAGTCFSVVLGVAATLPVWGRTKSITGVTWRDVLKRSQSSLLLAAFLSLGVYLGKLPPTSRVELTLLWEIVGALVMCGVGIWLSGKWLRSGLFIHASRSWRAIRPV